MTKKFSQNLSYKPTAKNVEDVALQVSRNRLAVVFIGTFVIFLGLILRLFEVSLSNSEDLIVARSNSSDFFLQRANIVDRNGSLLAVNLSTASMYANPNEIIDHKYSEKLLCKNLKINNCNELTKQLEPGKSFIWIKRHLSPRDQQKLHDLGLPGLYFIREEKRIYPHNNLFSHVLGYVDLDGKGISGIEKKFDEHLASNKQLELSLDLRIQEILREELQAQKKLHNAIGASGIIMDVNTGEVISMVSLPDFDPNHPNLSKERAHFNQLTLGVYEMASTFKVLTTAMALDGKFVNINDAFDTRTPVYIGRHRIGDMTHLKGLLSVPEILMYSSNIGTAQMAMKIGVNQQKKYIHDFGLTQPLSIELPEISRPLYPSDKNWSNASLITISYGHGISVTPMHATAAFASVVNGGKLLKPTLIRVKESDEVEYNQILNPATSEVMRKMLRLVVKGGSGKRADAKGYVVAGKTGTSEKIVGNKYSKNANIAFFVAAFPIDEPRYALMIMIDEAQKNELNHGYTTGGVIAAPVAAKVIPRIAPILGVKPRDETQPEIKDKLSLIYQARYKKNAE